MKNDDLYFCRICWFKNNDKPWWDDGKSPIYTFCPCCGVEFGYQDTNNIAILNYRNKWISNNLAWEKSDKKEKEWNFLNQIQNIPKEYLLDWFICKDIKN